MRKFFSQKSKHKAHQHSTLSTLTGSSSTTTTTTTTTAATKDDETLFTKKSKSQVNSSQPQVITTNLANESLIKSTSNESLSSEIKQQQQSHEAEVEEDSDKSKKLFVVVQGKDISE